MDFKPGYVVIVIKSSKDDPEPMEKRFIGKRGIVVDINDDRPSPISVVFIGVEKEKSYKTNP